MRVRRRNVERNSGEMIRHGGKGGQAASGPGSEESEERVEDLDAAEWGKRARSAAQSRPSAGAKTGYSSKYRGVSWKKRGQKWNVRIRVDGKDKYIGSFSDEIVAGRAYDAYVVAKNLNKPLNFGGNASAKGHVATSRFRGVGWHKRDKKWRVAIRVNGKQKSIGHFDNELEAAHAYDAYAITNGIDTPRNFPNEDEAAVVAETARVRAAPKKRKNAASKSSRFRGVSWNKREKKWQVYIYVAGTRTCLGRFTDEEKGARAYDKHIVDNNLDRPMNFPADAKEDDESSLEDEQEELPGESDDADKEYGKAAEAAVPAAKRRRSSAHSPHTVSQSVDGDMESSSSGDSFLGSDAEIQLLWYLTASAAGRGALPLHPWQPLRPPYI